MAIQFNLKSSPTHNRWAQEIKNRKDLIRLAFWAISKELCAKLIFPGTFSGFVTHIHESYARP
jgi:hypothetical protein